LPFFVVKHAIFFIELFSERSIIRIRTDRFAHNSAELLHALLGVAKRRLRITRKRMDRRIAPFFVGVERAEDSVIQIFANTLHEQRRDHDLGIVDLIERFIDRRCAEGVFTARKHFIGKACKRPLITALIELFAFHLLRRHVADRAARGHTETETISQSREAKINHFDLPLLVDEHVIGFHIQVKHVILVRDLDRVRNRLEHGRHHIRIERFREVFHEVGKRNAIDELHDDIGHIALDLEVIDRSNVGIVQKRCRARLFKPRDRTLLGEIRIEHDTDRFIVSVRVLQVVQPCVDLLNRKRARCCVFEWQALDGHLAIETRIPRHYDCGESARTGFIGWLVSIENKHALDHELLHVLLDDGCRSWRAQLAFERWRCARDILENSGCCGRRNIHEPMRALHHALPGLHRCCSDARGREHVECRADSERVADACCVAHFMEVRLFNAAAMNAGFGLSQDRVDAANVFLERVVDGHRIDRSVDLADRMMMLIGNGRVIQDVIVARALLGVHEREQFIEQGCARGAFRKIEMQIHRCFLRSSSLIVVVRGG